jgi:hypothetical protein
MPTGFLQNLLLSDCLPAPHKDDKGMYQFLQCNPFEYLSHICKASAMDPARLKTSNGRLFAMAFTV